MLFLKKREHMKTSADELTLRVQQHSCHAESEALPWMKKSVAITVNLLRQRSVMNKRGGCCPRCWTLSLVPHWVRVWVCVEQIDRAWTLSRKFISWNPKAFSIKRPWKMSMQTCSRLRRLPKSTTPTTWGTREPSASCGPCSPSACPSSLWWSSSSLSGSGTVSTPHRPDTLASSTTASATRSRLSSPAKVACWTLPPSLQLPSGPPCSLWASPCSWWWEPWSASVCSSSATPGVSTRSAHGCSWPQVRGAQR